MSLIITKLFVLFKVMDWTGAPWWWAAVFALCEFALSTTQLKKLADKLECC